MKLSKPSEDTLKGLAKLLKDLKGKDAQIMVPGTSQINEELTQQVTALEKDLRQLRKTIAQEVVAGSTPEAKGEVTGDGTGTALAEIKEPVLENVTVPGHLYVTGDVVFQAVPDTDLKEGDMMVKGDLFVTGDINLPAPQTRENACTEVVAEVQNNGFEVAIYANPLQLDSGAMLLGVRKAEEGVFTEPLYRKPK